MIMEREFTIEYRDWDSFMKDVQKPPYLKAKVYCEDYVTEC
jgi:hypothetical protein